MGSPHHGQMSFHLCSSTPILSRTGTRVHWRLQNKSEMPISFDLSHVPALRSLAGVAETLGDAAAGIVDRWLIVGATARDLILQHAYGLSERRKTADLDVAVAVASWEMFDALESRLFALGAQRNPAVTHEFLVGDWKVDVIPFAGVEKNGVIRWPDEDQTELNVMGFAEASTHALDVILPGGTQVLVTSPPGLLILKLIAWKDRHWRYPRRDGIDIRTLIDSYAEEWNQERLYEEAGELLQHFGFNNALAGAGLLGRDAAHIANPNTLQMIMAILETETGSDALLLASDNGRKNRRLPGTSGGTPIRSPGSRPLTAVAFSIAVSAKRRPDQSHSCRTRRRCTNDDLLRRSYPPGRNPVINTASRERRSATTSEATVSSDFPSAERLTIR